MDPIVQSETRSSTNSARQLKYPAILRSWLPARGNVIFTLLVVIVYFFAQSRGALGGFLQAPAAAPSGSSGVIAYQGRLADTAGNPLTGTYPSIFRLYSQSSGGTPLWEEQWTGPNSIAISDGLFNVMLGSLAPIQQDLVTANANLWLGVTVGSDDEMIPRVQVGSVFLRPPGADGSGWQYHRRQVCSRSNSRLGFRLARLSVGGDPARVFHCLLTNGWLPMAQ